jgi:hypothetical protein
MKPVQIHHDEQLAMTVRPYWTGDFVVVEVEMQPGWHTFSMDNQRRQDEALQGKPSLGVEKPTTIGVTGAMETVGPWYQTEPKNFSKPELRWFTWGFEGKAQFVARANRKPGELGEVTLRGQACSSSVCKNISVTVGLLADKPEAYPIELSRLTEVKLAASSK